VSLDALVVGTALPEYRVSATPTSQDTGRLTASWDRGESNHAPLRLPRLSYPIER